MSKSVSEICETDVDIRVVIIFGFHVSRIPKSVSFFFHFWCTTDADIRFYLLDFFYANSFNVGSCVQFDRTGALLGDEAREPFACDPKNAATRGLPFCKAMVATAERVKDLIGRFMVEEKVSLLVKNAAAVPRLEIKGYD